MPTSNSVFLGVRAAPQAELQGFLVKVLDYRDYTTVVGDLTEFTQLTLGPELNAVGAGSITLDADSHFWSRTLRNGAPARSLLDHEYLFEIWDDGVRRWQFLGTTVEESIVEEDGSRAITISGAGPAQVLTWACVLPVYFPPASNANQRYSYQFDLTWPAMRMWLHLLRAAQKRGTIKYVTPLFTDDRDSGGAKWTVVLQQQTITANQYYRPDAGTDLLALLNTHTGQDREVLFAERTEWFMWPGFKLDVRVTIGAHRENTVRFFEPEVNQVERTRVRSTIHNYVVTLDNLGACSFAADSASIAAWQQREQLQNQNMNVTDPAKRTAIGRVYLEEGAAENGSWTVQVPFDRPGRRVFKDYDIGDWIGLVTHDVDGANTVTPVRVMAINVTVAGLVPQVELTLQTLHDARLLALEAQITAILNRIGDLQNNLGDGVNLGGGVGDGGGLGGDPGGGTGGTGGTTTTSGIQVFIQPNDPGTAANFGDIWVQTAS